MSTTVVVAACALLCTLGAAEETVLRGRALHNSEKGDSRATKYFTDFFNVSKNTHGEAPEFEGAYLVGMILGFLVTGGFMIFGVTTLILDEIKRHKDFKKLLLKDESALARYLKEGELQSYQ